MTIEQPDAVLRRLPVVEFVILLATLFAMTAFSIDAMLPALPEIARDLTPENPNRAQLIITSFVLGMGLGTFAAGPLSDSFGRRATILVGALIYAIGALLAWKAPTFEWMLLARLLQGLGVAGPRIAGMALVRDLYSGRQMAQLISFVMMIFTLVPAVAPLIGSFIIAGFGWRAVFVAFILFAALATIWFGVRQPETLPPARRLPLSARPMIRAAKEVLSNRTVVLVLAVQSLTFASLFSTLSATQQIFDHYFGRGAEFPYWFAVIALLAGTASIVNARLVVRVGMRRMAEVTYAAQTVLSLVLAALFASGVLSGPDSFPIYLGWTVSVFFMVGLTLGNLNAIGLEPMGHIAGMAASLMTALATVISVIIAYPIGRVFDDTPRPLIIGVLICSALAYGLMQLLKRQETQGTRRQ
ncbi:MAG: multidrug effflux MFS transporter [Rhodobacteraceae bacterium]|nr:multidrug effflux MFS transporter [Paracoccaceae bacterium]